jgi:HAD superfamily hydrolase (TIGR01509 family)
MEILFERAALIDYFDFYLSNEDVSMSKPHPEIYATAIKRLKLLPNECLILEDNENGIKAAKDSGAHLMVIHDTHEVNLENIAKRISEIEAAS